MDTSATPARLALAQLEQAYQNDPLNPQNPNATLAAQYEKLEALRIVHAHGPVTRVNSKPFEDSKRRGDDPNRRGTTTFQSSSSHHQPYQQQRQQPQQSTHNDSYRPFPHQQQTDPMGLLGQPQQGGMMMTLPTIAGGNNDQASSGTTTHGAVHPGRMIRAAPTNDSNDPFSDNHTSNSNSRPHHSSRRGGDRGHDNSSKYL